MNAAARLVHQGILSRHIAFFYFLTKQQLMICILALSILTSAFCLIYVTYATRILHANYQHQLSEQNHFQIQYRQFLLERSALMLQVRIQHIAETQLNMVIPHQQSIIIIKQ